MMSGHEKNTKGFALPILTAPAADTCTGCCPPDAHTPSAVLGLEDLCRTCSLNLQSTLVSIRVCAGAEFVEEVLTVPISLLAAFRKFRCLNTQENMPALDLSNLYKLPRPTALTCRGCDLIWLTPAILLFGAVPKSHSTVLSFAYMYPCSFPYMCKFKC